MTRLPTALLALVAIAGLLVSVEDARAQGSVASDREVLEALYRTTNGPNWTDSTNWLTDAPLSEWFGVATENSRVTELVLFGNGLSGPIPPALGNLAFLQRLDFGGGWNRSLQQFVYNALSGPIRPNWATSPTSKT